MSFEYRPDTIQKSFQKPTMPSDFRYIMPVKLQLLKLCLLGHKSKIVQFYFETQDTRPCGLCQQAVLVLGYDKVLHAVGC
jgi:hypothetical protein